MKVSSSAEANMNNLCPVVLALCASIALASAYELGYGTRNEVDVTGGRQSGEISTKFGSFPTASYEAWLSEKRGFQIPRRIIIMMRRQRIAQEEAAENMALGPEVAQYFKDFCMEARRDLKALLDQSGILGANKIFEVFANAGSRLESMSRPINGISTRQAVLEELTGALQSGQLSLSSTKAVHEKIVNSAKSPLNALGGKLQEYKEKLLSTVTDDKQRDWLKSLKDEKINCVTSVRLRHYLDGYQWYQGASEGNI